MAHNKGSSLSNARGREIYVGSQIRDSISLLDVLYSNALEEEDIDSAVAKKAEADFYRGAPPQWLNFCWAERATSDDKTTPFIKRDGYTELIENIEEQLKGDLTSTMNLLHQPGSGGTTLAKQVLWDMRKTLRCAVLTGPTSDITAIAKQVIHLFTAGSQGHQNTVLLLLNDSQCQAFLGPPDPIYGGPSFEQRMEPFTHLIVTFPARQGQDKHVRMAHPLIAQQCVKKLKEEKAIAFPGLLCCLDKGYDESNLSQITKLWEEIQECEKKKDGGGENQASQNFILANIILSKVEAASPMLTPLSILRSTLERHLLANYGNQTPEFYLLVLLLFWPEEHKKIGFNIDLNKRIIEMQDSYNNTYKKHLRSRYLRPLIFLGKGEGLSRLVHRSKIDNLFVEENQMARQEARTDTIDQKWSSGEVWREPSVQDLLLPVNGVVRQHRVFACVDGKEIEVCADQQSKVWKSGDVCFYLGFTIRGPVAYGIHYPSHHRHFSHSDRMTGEVPRKMLEVPDIKSIKDGKTVTV
ncbi:sterile alpha motif domain-containing protein 9-like [Oncorhynchus nerka]|uniref:sterile alpha motif domain-containing protein 9-like n=1 Tax=Oncorhynchus nerka TaxID=8023 RepID=UPI0031B8A34D